MEFHLGTTSMTRLHTCHHDLIRLVTTAIATSPIDFGVVEGRRNEQRQEEAFREGRSKVHYPFSNHNNNPSLAVDLAPYGDGDYIWDDTELWKILSDHIKAVAKRLGLRIRWGGDFPGEWDKPHFELYWRDHGY